jgi:gamma-glutamyl-gamma-aminobutyrate hydrolase PuuD
MLISIAGPLIGITTHPASAPAWAEVDELQALIDQAEEQAGGLPVIVPFGLGGDALRGVCARLDGLL